MYANGVAIGDQRSTTINRYLLKGFSHKYVIFTSNRVVQSRGDGIIILLFQYVCDNLQMYVCTYISIYIYNT